MDKSNMPAFPPHADSTATDRDELLLLALVEALVTPSGKKSLDDIKRVSHWGWFVFSESEQGLVFWNSITPDLTY